MHKSHVGMEFKQFWKGFESLKILIFMFFSEFSTFSPIFGSTQIWSRFIDPLFKVVDFREEVGGIGVSKCHKSIRRRKLTLETL